MIAARARAADARIAATAIARAAVATIVAAVVATGAVAAGCDPPPVTRCTDSLTGVWRGEGVSAGGEPLAFHIVDHGAQLTVHPMFDGSVPPDGDKRGAIAYAPPEFAIRRLGGPGGSSLIGQRTQRISRDGQVCTFRRQAAIRDCADNALTLAWIELDRVLSFADCQAVSAPRFTRLRVRRAHP